MPPALNPYAIGVGATRKQSAYTKDDFLKVRFIFRLLFLVAFAAILSLVYIWSRVQVVHYGYEINRLKSSQSLLVEQSKKLQVELATLKAPQRMERVAHEKLNMQPPAEFQTQQIN